MIIFEAKGFCPHGENSIKPLPEGGWFVRSHGMENKFNFVVHVDKNPDVYNGNIAYSADAGETIRILGIGEQFGQVLYFHPGKYEDRVPHKDFFSAILQPKDKRKVVFGMNCIPKEIETFRTIVNAPEDRFVLVISKTGGEFVVFDLPVQNTANAMVSCDGQTVLVAQKDLFTIFDNTLF